MPEAKKNGIHETQFYSIPVNNNIYKDPLEYPKTLNTMICMAEMVATDIQTLSIDKLHAKQKKDIHCRNLAAQSHHENKNSFNPVLISPDGLP